MSLEFFLTNQAQITITMIPMFLCSYAKKKQQQKKQRNNNNNSNKKRHADPCAFKAFQHLHKL